MLNSFVALKYNKDYNPTMPTLTCHMDRLVGEKLDYKNLSAEEFKAITEENGKTNFIHYPELNPETIEAGRQEIYDSTKKYLPNFYYVPVGFDKSMLYFDDEELDQHFTIIEREELKDNELVMAYVDDLSFPAYKNQEGHIEYINPDLLLFIIFIFE